MSGRLIIGLTGSIGMGKSTIAAMFEKAGVPVFDADQTVRDLQGPGGELLADIEAEFPGSTGPEGVLRERLGETVFSDPSALARLEAIVHPAVARKRAEFLQNHSDQPIVLFDIPLLFEKGGREISGSDCGCFRTGRNPKTTRACPTWNDGREVCAHPFHSGI